MTPLSLKAKLIAGVGALVLMIVCFGLIYFPDLLRDQIHDAFDRELEVKCETLALGIGVGLGNDDFASIQRAIEFVKRDSSTRLIAILDSERSVIAVYPENGAIDYSGLLLGLTKLGAASAYFAPIHTNEGQYGYLAMVKSLDRIEETVRLGRLRLLGVGSVVFLISVLIVFWIASRVTEPVNELTRAAARFKEGDYRTRVDSSSQDEIGTLANGFNEMAETTEQALEDLEQERANLEARVRRRTAELSDSYEQLKREAAERARAEEELEEQRALSIRSDRLRSLGEMAAGIAHELNQPLVAVRGMAEHVLIASEEGWEIEPKRVLQKLERIVEQADRMSHIVNHVRLFAREAGKPETSPVDINDVVQSSSEMLGAQFASHGVDLKVVKAQGLDQVLANAFSLEEVVLNLMNNARHAVENGPNSDCGQVTVETLRSDHGACGPGVLIRVSDNGTGIPPETIEKVFDPFFTTKDPDEGTGLGLSVSKSIVESFDGIMSIESVVGSGTSVSVFLPSDSTVTAQVA